MTHIVRWLQDVRGESRDVWDQGPRPTCVVVATSTAHQLERPSIERYAPDALWLHAVQAGAASDSGTTIAATADALREWGQPSITAWPYESPFSSTAPPPAAGPPPWDPGTIESPVATVAAVSELLSSHRVPVVVIRIHQSFYLGDGTHMLNDLDPDEPFYGRHAICIVGYAEADGSEWFVVQNSWGTSWGQQGLALMSASYLAAILEEVAAVAPLST